MKHTQKSREGGGKFLHRKIAQCILDADWQCENDTNSGFEIARNTHLMMLREGHSVTSGDAKKI